jgi:hypothetical protein
MRVSGESSGNAAAHCRSRPTRYGQAAANGQLGRRDRWRKAADATERIDDGRATADVDSGGADGSASAPGRR